jgi:hypothetical protein
MTPKKLVTSGCSFTYGQGLSDPPSQAWPALVADLLGMQVTNLGTRGAGNVFIANQILDHHAQHGLADFYIIAWSHWARFDFGDSTSNRVIHLSQGSHNHLSQLRELIFTKHMNPIYLYKKYLNTVLMMQTWFKAQSANYIMFDALAGLHQGSYIADPVNRALARQIDQTRFIEFGIKNFDNWTDIRHRLPCGHPDAVAHSQMADILFREISRINEDGRNVSS